MTQVSGAMTSGEMTLVRLDQLPLNTHSSIPTMRLHGRLRPCSSRAAEIFNFRLIRGHLKARNSFLLHPLSYEPAFHEFYPIPPTPIFFFTCRYKQLLIS